MRRIAGMAVLAAACVAAPGFAEETGKDAIVAAPAMESVLTMRVDGEIAVDATGKVIGHTLKTKLDPRFQDLIAKAVPQWVFFPPTVDGKPASAKSNMRITLLGRKIPEGYEVSIDNVLFSGTSYRDWVSIEEALKRKTERETASVKKGDMTMSLVSRRPLPRYPSYYVNGMVTILLNIAPDGRVLDATPTQCSLYFADGTARQLARACKAMEDNAANAIKQWRVALDNHGKPIGDAPIRATIPVQYGMPGRGAEAVSRASESGNWRLESRTPYRTPAWLRDDRVAQRMGTSDAFGGELMPSESALRLRDGQIGKVL